MKTLRLSLCLCASVVSLLCLPACSYTTARKTTFDAHGKKLAETSVTTANLAVMRKVGELTVDGLGSLKNTESDPKVEAVTQVAERVTAAAVKAAKTP